jgi:hypothetical protein
MTCCGAWLALLALCPAPASAFTDVPNSHRYSRAIDELAQLGIVSGKDDGSFGPDDHIHRAQFAKMICGLLEIRVHENQSFAPFADLGPDDPGDLYPHEFVGAAHEAGITKGKTSTTFGPYLEITLPQVVTMVVRAADAFYPGLLERPQPDWYGYWAATDIVHGANVRRADYNDLLALLPMADRWTDVSRPATRGEVSQILTNLLHARAEPPSLSFEGTPLELAQPLSVKNNRYWLPLLELVARMGGVASRADTVASLELQDLRATLNLATGLYTANGMGSQVRFLPELSHGEVYLSLIDVQQLLRLTVFWDEDARSIGLFRSRAPLTHGQQAPRSKRALVRFEDITANQSYSSAESLAKLRIIFDYCYKNGVPMHLGWVPRYIDPKEGIDNAPAQDPSMHNANFVYTLDYFLDRGGLVGLHGYTHQYGSYASLASAEFDAAHNTTESSIRRRVQFAIADANHLDMPISFFESPHYASLFYQQQVLGQFFDVLYEPKVSAYETKPTRILVGDRTVTFVPTPLGYLVGAGDEANVIARMKVLRAGDLASFFYHPNIEFDFISMWRADDGFPVHDYAPSSPLHRLLDAFMGEGYAFVDVDAL